MKLECQVEKIKNAVSQVERITGKNLTLPILSSILLIASGKSLKLRSTNLSLGIEIEIPAKVDKEGVVAVSGAVLDNVFSNIPPSESAEINLEGGNLFVKTKKNKISIKSYPSDDFPTIPAVNGQTFEISSKKLIEGIKSVYYSASVSDIKPEISSVYIYQNGDNLFFVSTDSFRLAEKKIKMKGVSEIGGILIPFKSLAEIIRVFGDIDGDITVNFSKNQISFSSGRIYLTSRIIDGVFPDYKQIMPKETKTEAVVLKQDLLSALRLSNIFSGKFNQVDLKIFPKNKILQLSSNNAELGENTSLMDGALTGEDVEAGLNYKYFLDCFQSIGQDSVSIRFNTASKPVIISGVGDPSFTYLIMPMIR